MTIKTCGTTAGQAVKAVRKYITESVVRRVCKEHKPNDDLHLHLNWQVQSPEHPLNVAQYLAEHFDAATGGWLTYDLESSRFFVKLDEGGQYWLNEEEMVICCYRLLWPTYYLDGDEKRPFNPNISQVTEVVTALKVLRVKTER